MSEGTQPPQYTPPQGQYVSGRSKGQQYRDELFARCAQGQHERKTEYGMCGIVTAVALFPFGLICLFTDSQVKCSRCGVTLSK